MNFNLKFGKSISHEDQIGFAKNLSVLLKGNISINDAMDSLAAQAKPGPMREVLRRIKERLEKGVSLSNAMNDEEKSFGKIFVSLVGAGEVSGSLADNLEFLATWLERDHNLKKEINSVLLYPKIVLVATVLLGGGLAIFILPKLVPMFTSLKVELPLITRIVLGISLFLQNHWPRIIMVLVLVFAAGYLIYKIRPVKYFFHKLIVFLPYVKEIVVGYQLALFSQLMGTLLRSGISIDEALRVAEVGTLNLYYKKILLEIIDRVNKGISLVETMKKHSDLYPVNSTSVLSVGENTGTLEESFFKLSDFWTKDIINKTKNLPTIIEPIMLVIIAAAVGLIAISIIMPIYKITGSLGV